MKKSTIPREARLKSYLACVLIGMVLTLSAVGVRAAGQAFYDLKQRVSTIEGYIGALDQMMRQAR